MSTKNIFIWLTAIVLIIGGVYYFSRGNYEIPGNAPTSKNAETSTSAAVATNKIEITANGFLPSNIKIKKGDTVTWTNNDSAPHWPATAMHPTHTVYPGSNISKCGTTEQDSIFDACKGLAPGESYSFKFDQAGTWNYHDHVKPVVPFFGSVTVE